MLSRKGQSTTGIRRHLRVVHKIDGFGEKTSNQPKRSHVIPLSVEKKAKLHQLALNCILEDGRSFNDLNKKGILKLFNGLLEGMFRSRFEHREQCEACRIPSTTSQYSQQEFKAIKERSFEETDCPTKRSTIYSRHY